MKQTNKHKSSTGVWLLAFVCILSLVSGLAPVSAAELTVPADTGETVPVATEPAPEPEPTQPSERPATPQPQAAKPAFLLINNDVKIPEFKAGDKNIKLKLSLLNWGLGTAEKITVSPVMNNENERFLFPFVIEKGDYSQGYGDLANSNPGDSSAAKQKEFGPFTVRSDINTGYYRLEFAVNYYDPALGWQAVTRYSYVKINNPKDKNPPPKPPEQGNDFPGGIPGGDISGGSGVDSKQPMPRLIVSGFSTDPAKVYGGSQFKLKLLLRNTSKTTAVNNIRLVLTGSSEGKEEAVSFLPVSGASTVYVENIAKDSVQEVTIEMQAGASLPQKVYPLNIKMEYEDEDTKAFTNDEMISIKVFQEARCDFGQVETMPSPVSVEGEVNIMFPLYNKGKSTLYNASVNLAEDSCLTASEVYLGNIESGATKDVDMMAKAVRTNDSEPVKLIISYEDEEGQKSQIEKEIELEVTEAMPEDLPMDPNMMMPEEEEKTGLAWWVWLLILLILTGLASLGIVHLVKKKKADREQAEIEDQL